MCLQHQMLLNVHASKIMKLIFTCGIHLSIILKLNNQMYSDPFKK